MEQHEDQLTNIHDDSRNVSIVPSDCDLEFFVLVSPTVSNTFNVVFVLRIPRVSVGVCFVSVTVPPQFFKDKKQVNKSQAKTFALKISHIQANTKLNKTPSVSILASKSNSNQNSCLF